MEADGPVKAASAALWEATFRAIGDGVALVDARNRVEQCNAAMLDLLGLTMPLVLGRPLALLLEQRLGTLELPLPDAATPRCLEMQAGARWLRITVDRCAGGAVYTIADVSDRHRLEEAMRQQAQELIAADRHKDEFLAMLAHELRNPLATASNALYLLEAAPPTSAQAGELRGTLRRQLVHLSRMVDDLLDVSRITRGRIELKRTPIDLRDLVREVVQAARLHDCARTIRLELPSVPALALVDRARMEQVVGNLILNALKYSATTTQVVVNVEARNERVTIRVRDNGIGIAAESLDDIFELFVQGPVPLDRTSGGLGVGLTLVKRLVTMHSGSVRAYSDGPGKGSEFVIELRRLLEDEEEPTREVRGLVARAAAGGTVLNPPKRVLIVEDLDDAREVLREMLSMWGHEVFAAAHGGRALELAKQLPPNVALIDIGLPEMDGYEVARRLRKLLGPGVRLVALTGYGQARDQKRALAAGFDVHLVKPCAPDALRDVLD